MSTINLTKLIEMERILANKVKIILHHSNNDPILMYIPQFVIQKSRITPEMSKRRFNDCLKLQN